MSKVNVYGNEWAEGPVIARVEYNSRLDHWNGSNWSDGGIGTHLGITQLRDGRYVLIHGTQWEGEQDWAEVVTDERALQAVLKSGNDHLLDQPRFRRLKELASRRLISECV
ncbi:hypothetical protein P4H94_04480 [Paenibacillus macerans]|uniref:hypothetical protein n=1 Tax=Paenibacillus macerans TaxID=44252 RepID=UPI002DBF0BAD|nr:hypothetical protein [Paenibacillus macerans]MEC0136144.1 hypothetical protein [Paenibacillus macerans]